MPFPFAVGAGAGEGTAGGGAGIMDGMCSWGTDGGGNWGRGSALAGRRDSNVLGTVRSTLSRVSAMAAHSECIWPV